MHNRLRPLFEHFFEYPSSFPAVFNLSLLKPAHGPGTIRLHQFIVGCACNGYVWCEIAILLRYEHIIYDYYDCQRDENAPKREKNNASCETTEEFKLSAAAAVL